MDSFAARTSLLRPSPTLAISARAKQLKSEGKDVISFGAGEPDFDTPSQVIEAAIRALKSGQTRYTPTPGIPALREAIANKFNTDNGLDVKPDQIIVSSGAKQSLFNSMMILVQPGDEVLIIAPYWMTYVDQVNLAGGTPVIVPTSSENGFVPTIEDLQRAFSDRTKAIVINSPCNPSGAIIPLGTMTWIAEQAIQRKFWIISDEIYEKVTYGCEHIAIASLGQEVADRTITINGCSKSYAMTGWRIGFCAAPIAVAKAMSNLQDSVTSNATSFAQYGALEALKMSQTDLEPMRKEFESRRDAIVKALNAIDCINVKSPQGAFYVLPDFSKVLEKCNATDVGFAEMLLDESLVATVPGSVFGAPGHIRLSYACSLKDISTGIGRIQSFVSRVTS